MIALGVAPVAARAADPHFLGSSRAGVPSAHGVARDVTTTTVSKPFTTFKNAQYATGGVALRNRGLGVINISGLVTPIQGGVIYFANLFSGSAPSTVTLNLAYLASGKYSPGRNLTLDLIATGADPCWGSSGIAVYRLKVPGGIFHGNGAYQITLNASTTALTTGEDPWDDNVQFPAAEGASLVIVGTGSATVGVYDASIPSGTTFDGSTYSYTLKLPAAAPGNLTLFDSIGADGQIGDSRFAAGYNNTITINGTLLSGNGGIDSTSDFGGTSGLPLPQLWDDTGHDITGLIASGATTLPVAITSNPAGSGGSDCISTVANVVSVQ
jgi:hypothetical protein